MNDSFIKIIEVLSDSDLLDLDSDLRNQRDSANSKREFENLDNKVIIVETEIMNREDENS